MKRPTAQHGDARMKRDIMVAVVFILILTLYWKRDSAKRDSAKWDSAKRDSAKQDSAKRDSAKRDSAKRDSAKRDRTFFNSTCQTDNSWKRSPLLWRGSGAESQPPTLLGAFGYSVKIKRTKNGLKRVL